MYGGEEMRTPSRLTDCPIEAPRRTLTQTLQDERARLQHRIDEIDAVLEALQANPTVQSVLDLLQKNRCI